MVLIESLVGGWSTSHLEKGRAGKGFNEKKNPKIENPLFKKIESHLSVVCVCSVVSIESFSISSFYLYPGPLEWRKMNKIHQKWRKIKIHWGLGTSKS